MKKLFALRDTRTNKITTTYFGDKQKAKEARDELNSSEGNHYVVTRGPDHKKSNGR